MFDFEKTNFTDQETIYRMISIASELDSKFLKINQERYQNFNALITKLQWAEADRKKLEAEARPVNSYPLIAPIIRYMSSVQKGSRKALQTTGVTPDDYDFASTMTKVLGWSLRKTKFDYALSRAALDALIARWGWVYQGFSYEDDPLGQIVTRRINPFRIKFDMDFTDITMRDCNYIQDAPWLLLEEILQTYALDDDDMWEEMKQKGEQYIGASPQQRKGLVSTILDRLFGAAGYLITGKTRESENSIIANSYDNFYDSATSRFRVLEIHERRLEKRMTYYEPELDKTYDITDHVSKDNLTTRKYNYENPWDSEKLRMLIESKKWTYDNVDRKIQKMIWVVTTVPAFQMKLQDKPYPIQNGNFFITPVFAYDFHVDISQSQSPVDELIDVQSSYNKRRSTILELIMRQAAQGFTYEDGAIDETNMDDWYDRKIGGGKKVNKNYWEKVKQDEPPEISQSLWRFEAEDLQMVEKISGVNSAQRGFKEGNQEPAAMFRQKREQGEEQLQYFFDNLDQGSLIIGRNCVDLIQHFMTEEQILDISEDKSRPEWLIINQRTVNGIVNDLSRGKFDIEISHTPYGKTAQEIEYIKLLDVFDRMIEVSPEQAMMSLPILIKASDSPYKNELLQIGEKITGLNERQLQLEELMKFMNMEKERLGLKQADQGMKKEDLALKGMERDNQADEFVFDTMKEAVG